MKQALRMLARDWRAGELRVLAMALVIAVAAITSVAFFADRVGQALARDAHQLLGADLVLVSDHPWPRESAGLIDGAGLARAEGVNFISMASGKESTLSGVKAVTENYPLRGRLRIAKAPGSAVERLLSEALEIGLGYGARATLVEEEIFFEAEGTFWAVSKSGGQAERIFDLPNEFAQPLVARDSYLYLESDPPDELA